MSGFPFDPSNIELVVFDLDGTLYHPQTLKTKLTIRIGLHYAFQPWRWSDLAIIRGYRRAHEELAGKSFPDAGAAQLNRTLEIVRRPKEVVKPIIDRWFFQAPLSYLEPYANLENLLEIFRKKEIKTGVWSDYPAAPKLAALDLEFDGVADAFMPEVAGFKPATKGLEFLMDQFAVTPGQTLMIGDREDRDGEAARKCKTHFIQIFPEKAEGTYRKLTKAFDSVNR